MSGFEGPDDWAEWPPEEKPSEDRYDLGIRDGYGIREMSMIAVDGYIRLTISEGRDFVIKTLSPGMARRIGRWLLDRADEEKQPPDGLTDPDPSPSEDETGKREEDPKEEHMEAMRREAEQLGEQWEKTKKQA